MLNNRSTAIDLEIQSTHGRQPQQAHTPRVGKSLPPCDVTFHVAETEIPRTGEAMFAVDDPTDAPPRANAVATALIGGIAAILIAIIVLALIAIGAAFATPIA